MTSLKNLLLTGIGVASLALTGCGDKQTQKEPLSQTYFDSLIENNNLKSIDSIALNNSTSIKITKEGFKQYNNGLLIREVEEDGKDEGYITNHFYNNKNQKIKSVGYEKFKDEKTNKEKIEKTDSTFYEYNDKGQLIKTRLFSEDLGGYDKRGKAVWGEEISFYKYDEQGRKIEEKTDENGIIYLEKYKYDEKGKLIKEESSYLGQMTYFLYPNDFIRIVAKDINSDGLIDEVGKYKLFKKKDIIEQMEEDLGITSNNKK